MAEVQAHVVVVDDAATNLAILSAILGSRPETDVHPFESSRDALSYAHAHPVDAFIIDFHMPAPSGLEMVELLRADPRFAFVPIIIVTAEHEREHRLDALAHGANDFIERPIEPRELLARLDTLLSLHAARKQLTDNVLQLERSLLVREREAREQAERMVTLWRIVTNTELATDDVPDEILSAGARGIRPGHLFNGNLSRIDSDEFKIIARTQLARGTGLRVGERLPLANSIAGALADRPMTLTWDDVSAVDGPDAGVFTNMSRFGARAVIGTSFYAGRTMYALVFWSRTLLDAPFSNEDRTYIELLASYFAGRMQQAWQAERVAYHLQHDTLTGLRNRTQFRLEARIESAKHDGGTLAIVGLDAFHFANENFGHIIGDALLVEVAAGLAGAAIGDEIVARLAGDTFGIFLPGVADDESARRRLAAFAARFNEPFSTGDREGKEFIPLSATIGYVIADDASTPIDTLLSRADTALIAGKRIGRGHTVAFEPGMESEEAARDRFLAELALAVERNEFELYFQPHIDLATGRPAGAEALIRWNHPTRGLLSPSDFIPFAEKHNVIRPISRWVMYESACAAERFRAIDPAFRVYFNLSALDLADRAILDGFHDLAANGLHLANVGVELTETTAMQDLGATLHTVKALQELGIRIAIDDFGVGYSSLSLLKRLPVDLIKIDRTFMSEILFDRRDAVIAEAVIGFGQEFGFVTLGEGVETQEQLQWLREHNCRYAQGYFMARPQGIDTFANWLEAAQQPVA